MGHQNFGGNYFMTDPLLPDEGASLKTFDLTISAVHQPFYICTLTLSSQHTAFIISRVDISWDFGEQL